MSRFFWFANVLFRLSCNSPIPGHAHIVSIQLSKLFPNN